MEILLNNIKRCFVYQFGGSYSLYTSPGRINLLGEHTDYNAGYVLPAAINKSMAAAIQPNNKNKVCAYSIDLNDYCEFELNEKSIPQKQWAKYIFGVCMEVMKLGYEVKPFNTVFSGNIPLGAGLSSSAALESTYAFAINDLFNDNRIDKFDLARIGQSTEHNYCGVKCGIMDQFASIFGKSGNLIRLDCQSMQYDYFPFNPEGYKIVLINSMVKHELVDSAYNKRRESCERVSKALGREKLRGVNLRQLDVIGSQLSEEDYMRAQYVIEEERRILEIGSALIQNNISKIGSLMYQTHQGLSKLYEVSCVELDFLNDLAKECKVTGSRMMGGGFGGCTINLVKKEHYQSFINTVKVKYAQKFNQIPMIIEVSISDGSRKIQ